MLGGQQVQKEQRPRGESGPGPFGGAEGGDVAGSL